MCFKPIKIQNPKYRTMRFDPRLDKAYLEVPCGDCEQCRLVKQDEYFVRSYYEYISTKEDNGFTFFETFTYAPDKVPMHFGLKCFCKKDWQDFMKRLRTHLDELGIDHKNGKLKYLVVSEFGEKNGHPHYHAIFNCHFRLSDNDYENAEKFKQLLIDSWKNGLLDNEKKSENHDVRPAITQVVNDLGLVKYVSKYVSKSSKWIDQIQKQVNMSLTREQRLNAYLKDSSRMFLLYMKLVLTYGGEDNAYICKLLRAYNAKRRTKEQKEALVDYLDNNKITYKDILKYQRYVNANIEDVNKNIKIHNKQLKVVKSAFPNLESWHIHEVVDSSFLNFSTDPHKLKYVERLDIKPFVQLSHGYGQYFFQNKSEIELQDALISGKIHIAGMWATVKNDRTGINKFNLPRYYIKKTLFDYDKVNKTYILNEKGKDIQTEKKMLQVEETVKRYSNDSEVRTAVNSIADYIKVQARQFFDEKYYKTHDVIYTFKEIQKQILRGRPFSHFVKYVTCLKDYKVLEPITDEHQFSQLMFDLPDTYIHDIIQHRFDLLGVPNIDTSDLPFNSLYDSIGIQDYPYYNDCEVFTGYDQLAFLYDKIAQIFKRGQELKLLESQKLYNDQEKFKREHSSPLFHPLIKN